MSEKAAAALEIYKSIEGQEEGVEDCLGEGAVRRGEEQGQQGRVEVSASAGRKGEGPAEEERQCG
mgnify:CR=1 FL=1